MPPHTAETLHDRFDETDAYPQERHVTFITFARIWARGAMARTCPLRLVAPRFVLSGQSEALVPFHNFMLALCHRAGRAIGLADYESAPLLDDELLILEALDAASRGDLRASRMALAGFICAPHLDAVAHKALLLVAQSGWPHRLKKADLGSNDLALSRPNQSHHRQH